MIISRAETSEADALTAIARAAKGHWDYPDRWMAAWRDTLTLKPPYIAAHETYAARDAGIPIGFCSLEREGNTLRLEHLWVPPGRMGGGIGRALFEHARRRAGELGFAHFEVESDPHAAGFYERMGAGRVRTNFTRMDGQTRELPVFVCHTIARAIRGTQRGARAKAPRPGCLVPLATRSRGW